MAQTQKEQILFAKRGAKMKKANETKVDVAEKANAPFPTRLRALMEREQMKQGDLAALLNVTRQSANQYCLGLSSPDTEKLCKTAVHFGVTTDYLLGMTDISSADPTMKMACDFTGLSETAIQQLRALNEEVFTSDQFPTVTPIATLSEIISQGDNFVYFMDYVMHGYIAEIKERIFEKKTTLHRQEQEETANNSSDFLQAKKVISKYGYECFATRNTSELYFLQAMTGIKIICDDLKEQIGKAVEDQK